MGIYALWKFSFLLLLSLENYANSITTLEFINSKLYTDLLVVFNSLYAVYLISTTISISFLQLYMFR